MSDKTKRYPWNKGKNDDDGGMTEVYAGPPFEPDQMEGVYAGTPIQEPMMCVYAGPEYFSGRKSDGMGTYIPPEQMPAFCKACGNPLKDGYKFCPFCGAPAPKEEE